MDIVEFLRARLDEDEAVARAAVIPAHNKPGAYKPHPELAEWFYDGDEVEYVQTPEMRAHKYADRYYVTMDSEGLSPSVEGNTATHIARHDAAEDVCAEMARHARQIEGMAKGRRARRVVLGGCPQVALDENAVTIGPCEGTLVALVHDEEDMLPAVVRCDTDREHAWTPGEWPALGRKLGRTSQAGELALVNAITGRTGLLRHTSG